MAVLRLKNNAKSTINMGGGLAQAAATLTVTNGAVFPASGDFLVTLWDKATYPDPADDSGMEIVRVTARSTHVLTIVRAQEGTTDVAHGDGEAVEMLITAGQLTELKGLVPVGVTVALLKSLTGCPALPTEFVECNGQTLTDADSPFNSVVIPDLNAYNGGSPGGVQRFLRGKTTSGGTGGADDHRHTICTTSLDHYHCGCVDLGCGCTNTGYANVSEPNGHSHSFSTGNESSDQNVCGDNAMQSVAAQSHTHSGSTDTQYPTVSDSGHIHSLCGNVPFCLGGAYWCCTPCTDYTGNCIEWALPSYYEVVWVLRIK